MKLAGFLLLVAGWAVVLSALALLRSPGQRTAFVVLGIGVEVLGLVIAFRSHVVVSEERG